MVLGSARRRVSEALDRPTSVLVVGSSQESRALARRLADDYDVSFVSDRSDLVNGATADGIDARESRLDEGSELAALDLSADAAIVAASRDRTNLFVVQHLRSRYDVPRLVVRVNDPDREDVFTGPEIETICSTDVLAPEIRTALGEAI
ncbi:NAD-binding protein [Halosimplex amylolyticum]|uniref:NAD-binding protein n=1 Tax=Halosimplex amylolyticum TaxID=3396616 RepID=UPI003F57B81D